MVPITQGLRPGETEGCQGAAGALFTEIYPFPVEPSIFLEKVDMGQVCHELEVVHRYMQ